MKTLLAILFLACALYAQQTALHPQVRGHDPKRICSVTDWLEGGRCFTTCPLVPKICEGFLSPHAGCKPIETNPNICFVGRDVRPSKSSSPILGYCVDGNPPQCFNHGKWYKMPGYHNEGGILIPPRGMK